jgi:hypothetical protein
MYRKNGFNKSGGTPTVLFSLLMALTLLTAVAFAAPAPGALFTAANPARTPGDLADGNGDMEIYAGGDTDSSGDLVWTIVDDDVYEVEADGGLDLVWTIQDDDLVGPDGCTSEPGISAGSLFLRNAAGDVLFTVKGRHLWYGAVDVPNEGSSGWETAHSQRAYDVWHNQFYAGPKGRTDAVSSATANIQEASALRKLAIMALVEGECGSSGLGPRPTPQ